jgi:hypothetical protein
MIWLAMGGTLLGTVLTGAVLGSLFAGLATPTKSAAVGVAAALVIGVSAGELTWRGVLRAQMNTLVTFCVIGMDFMGAVILAQSISVLALPQELLRQITGLGISPLGVLVIIVAVYVVLGTIFDGLSMMIMTLPIVFPLLVGLGYDPVWLGVLITLLIEIGMLTPPVGMNIFVLTGMTGGQVRLGQAALAALPYWLALLTLIALIVAAPGIVLWLPQLMMPCGNDDRPSGPPSGRAPDARGRARRPADPVARRLPPRHRRRAGRGHDVAAGGRRGGAGPRRRGGARGGGGERPVRACLPAGQPYRRPQDQPDLGRGRRGPRPPPRGRRRRPDARPVTGAGARARFHPPDHF